MKKLLLSVALSWWLMGLSMHTANATYIPNKLPLSPGFVVSIAEDYSYQGEVFISNPVQLNRRTFIPAEHEEGRGWRRNLEIGEVKIVLNGTQLKFEGVKDLPTFNILAQTITSTGFDFKLTDGRGTVFSKMKIVTENGFVKLIYLTSRKYGDHTFYLAEKTNSDLAREKAFYTHHNFGKFSFYRELKDVIVKPYLVNNNVNSPYEINKVVPISQNFSIAFSDKSVTFFENNQARATYEVKRVKRKETRLKDNTGVKSVMELILKTKEPRKIKLFFDKEHFLQCIQINEVRYSLM